jgi:ABC-2 type transport system ATP-binding protein
MIQIRHLTKRFGATVAVDDLSFDVEAGKVTGFLGPNGAGKTTTLRLLLGLARPDKGTATFDGVPYQQLRRPMREVGALLEAKSYHPGRKARDHLLSIAQAGRIPARRVEEVLDLVGLSNVAGRKVGTFSLGMAQRLGIAAALLGDPPVLIFDEPVNGLDPEGILWARTLMQSLAAQGRTVFVSSHLMSEMSLTASHVVVIGRGHLIASSPVEELVRQASGSVVRLRTPMPDAVTPRLVAAGASVRSSGDGALSVTGLGTEAVGDMELTKDDFEFRARELGRESLAARS